MSHKLTRLEHPWPAVTLHWAHLLSFFVLIATGLAIHAHSDVIGSMQFVRQTHFIVMYVFILTTVMRIYWAFFGAGSARARRDWSVIVTGVSSDSTGADWKATPAVARLLPVPAQGPVRTRSSTTRCRSSRTCCSSRSASS